MPAIMLAGLFFSIVSVTGLVVLKTYLQGKPNIPIKPDATIINQKAKSYADCQYAVTHVKCNNGQACMTNPAASFCVCMGGSTEIIEKPEGQAGVCVIHDKKYDEWDYFRNAQDGTAKAL